MGVGCGSSCLIMHPSSGLFPGVLAASRTEGPSRWVRVGSLQLSRKARERLPIVDHVDCDDPFMLSCGRNCGFPILVTVASGIYPSFLPRTCNGGSRLRALRFPRPRLLTLRQDSRLILGASVQPVSYPQLDGSDPVVLPLRFVRQVLLKIVSAFCTTFEQALPDKLIQGRSRMSNITSASGEASVSSGNMGVPPSTSATVACNNSQPPVKRKRNLPGTPDPDAEVIALSPKTLMATNRFVCEICNKGFQRDQNLQLHRRGHNLPWKLRQRTSKEIRKRVYICPEPSCVHHDPSRALGDLTGIKKHFCRKHGEKKWKCDKCSKRYAVQSDWKAHSKTCGTREYRCDCGTLFSRRDSFITHRAFCDALAEESARVSAGKQGGGPESGIIGGPSGGPASLMGAPSSPRGANRTGGGPLDSLPPPASRAGIASNIPGLGEGGLSLVHPRWGQVGPGTVPSAPGSGTRLSLWLGPGPGPGPPCPPGVLLGPQAQQGGGPSQLSPLDSATFVLPTSHKGMHWEASMSPVDLSQTARSAGGGLVPLTTQGSGSLFANLFASGAGLPMQGDTKNVAQSGRMSGLPDFPVVGQNRTDRNSAVVSLSLASTAGMTTSSSSANSSGAPSVVPISMFNPQQLSSTSQMSATALLQKAAQMGATASNSSLLRGFGLSGSESNSVALGALWQTSCPEPTRVGGMLNMSSGAPGPQLLRRSNEHAPNPHGIMSSMGHGGFSSQGFCGDSISSQSLLSPLMGSVPFFGAGGMGASGLYGASSVSSTVSGLPQSNNLPPQHRMPGGDSLGGQQHAFQGSMPKRGQLLPGLGGNQGPDDGSDRLTRDFLGVGGEKIITASGGPVLQKELANIQPLTSETDRGSFNPRERYQATEESGQAPTTSWDG